MLSQSLRSAISTHDLTKRSTRQTTDGDGYKGISTHDLTKRSTGNSQAMSNPILISTHDLTKRSTRYLDDLLLKESYFNSQPHEEVDHQLYMILERSQYFNSRPHEEVD